MGSGKITRRALGLSAAAATTGAFAQTEKAYTGALDGYEDQVEGVKLDPVRWSQERWKQAPRYLKFQAENKRQAVAWQKRLRAKVTQLLGGFPESRTPLAVKPIETKQFDGYTREKFVFESRPGVAVLAYLLTPKTGSGPWPVAICVPGHGRGVDDIVGIDERGRARTNKAGYQRDFAIQVVERGMAALALEPMGFGVRRDAVNKKKGLGQKACDPAAGAALLLGETMIGWRVWDVMRAIDWIETRRDLDAKRIGCVGISGGGTCTVFAAAVEPRIQAALVSGYLCQYRESILSIAHCIDNYVPGILNWAECSDVAGLMAPRALFVESGDRDPIFPVAGVETAYAEVERIYAAFGARDRLGKEIFAGEHVFHGRAGLPFLAAALKA